MKRKILTMITIGSLFLVVLTGCGDSSGNTAKSETVRTSDTTVKSDTAITDAAERPDGSEAEITKKEAEEEIKEETEKETENSVVREAGFYHDYGGFVPWDELDIDVETDYTLDNYETEAKSPYKLFSHLNYAGDLVLPDNITRIGDFAFKGCDYLYHIDLSNTQITSIGKYAFNMVVGRLISIELPDTLTSIGDGAFADCELLESVDLSNKQITNIGDGVFEGCQSLTSIDLPDTLTSIGDGAFCACKSLTNINYAGTMEEWNAVERYSYWKEFTLETITCSDGVITL